MKNIDVISQSIAERVAFVAQDQGVAPEMGHDELLKSIAANILGGQSTGLIPCKNEWGVPSNGDQWFKRQLL